MYYAVYLLHIKDFIYITFLNLHNNSKNSYYPHLWGGNPMVCSYVCYIATQC